MEIPHSQLINETSYGNYPSFTHESPILAQVIEDVDVMANMVEAWYSFVDSGQVWALLIGLLIGYSFKGLTSY